MKLLLVIKLIVIYIITCPIAYAASKQPSDDQISTLINEARFKEIEKDPLWIGLIRYVKPTLPFGSIQSNVINPDFFLAEDGNRNPRNELNATIEGLLSPVAENMQNHPRCRFPARMRFLQKQLNLPKLPEINCPNLKEWRQNGKINGVSIIFASGHLSNPASYYGHLLLKFDVENDGPLSEELLDTTINYGATNSDSDNPFIYITKGLTGGYNSTFTHLNFYHHNHNYAETQLRDLWLYQLNLTSEQINFFIDHSWEMLGVENKYYFVLQNCAYRIAEMVQLVTGEPLLPKAKLWATPIDVFEKLSSQYNPENGLPLVKEIKRYPSRQNRFRDKFAKLSNQERNSLKKITADLLDDSNTFDRQTNLQKQLISNTKKLSPHSRAAVIETGIDYISFLEIKNKTSKSASNKLEESLKIAQNTLLAARLELPPAAGPQIIDQKPPPHTGNKSTLGQVRYVYNDTLGSGVELRLRPVHSDFLSLTSGALPYSELSFLDATLLLRDNELSLRNIDLVRITTLNISETGLADDSSPAWRLRFGAEARELSCDGCPVGFIESGYGKGWKLAENIAIFGLVNGRATIGDNGGSLVQAGATVGAIASYGKFWRMQVEGGLFQELDANQSTAPFVRMEHRFGGSQRWDIRTSLEYQDSLSSGDALEFSLAASFFW